MWTDAMASPLQSAQIAGLSRTTPKAYSIEDFLRNGPALTVYIFFNGRKNSIFCVDAIAEEMEILPFILTADFDARHQVQPQPGRFIPCFRDGPDRIMVGHGDRRHTGLGTLAHQIGWLELAVHAVFGMHMQIKPCFHICTSFLQTSPLLYYASAHPASRDEVYDSFFEFYYFKILITNFLSFCLHFLKNFL